MSPTESRSGFRLPWSTEGRAPTEHDDAPEAQPTTEASPDGGPAQAAVEAVQDAATDDAATQAGAGDFANAGRPEADGDTPTMPDAQPDATQPELEVQQVFPSVDAPADLAPDSAATAVRGGEHQRTHRPEKFLADLTRAMQAAAEAARDQSLGQFEADSKHFVDEIQARSAEEASTLRQDSESDIASTREWSKAEMARIREETEARIAKRRAQLDHDLETHAELVQGRIGRVNQRLEAYRAEMADFFEQLLAVDDPTRFATLAEQMPEPPTLEEAWLNAVETDQLAAGSAEAVVADPDAQAPVEPVTEPPAEDLRRALVERAFDFGAAEAEAAAAAAVAKDTDQGDGSDEAIPDITFSVSDRLAGLVPSDGGDTAPAAEAEATTTQVLVSGLVSVASIAGFKRQLGRVTGVTSVSVSSGPEGEFVFAVSHQPNVELAGEIAAFSGFEAQITDASDGVLRVGARDPEA